MELTKSLQDGNFSQINSLVSAIIASPCVALSDTALHPLWIALSASDGNLRLRVNAPMSFVNANVLSHRLTAIQPLLREPLGFAPDRSFDLGDGGDQCDIAFSASAGAILVPDVQFLESRGYEDVRNAFASVPDWKDRLPLVFWRGSTTGIRADAADPLSLPRVALCLHTLNSSFFDCAIGGDECLHQVTEQEKDAIRKSMIVKTFSPWQDLVKFQYHIDIDGNTNSWPGLFFKLLSGSPVLKITSPMRQWYYDRLIPYENFIPVLPDLSDLFDQVEWCRLWPEKAQAIGQSGRDLALSCTFESQVAIARKRLYEGA